MKYEREAEQIITNLLETGCIYDKSGGAVRMLYDRLKLDMNYVAFGNLIRSLARNGDIVIEHNQRKTHYIGPALPKITVVEPPKPIEPPNPELELKKARVRIRELENIVKDKDTVISGLRRQLRLTGVNLDKVLTRSTDHPALPDKLRALRSLDQTMRAIPQNKE